MGLENLNLKATCEIQLIYITAIIKGKMAKFRELRPMDSIHIISFALTLSRCALRAHLSRRKLMYCLPNHNVICTPLASPQ